MYDLKLIYGPFLALALQFLTILPFTDLAMFAMLMASPRWTSTEHPWADPLKKQRDELHSTPACIPNTAARTFKLLNKKSNRLTKWSPSGSPPRTHR
jgi:hypothetical protein